VAYFVGTDEAGYGPNLGPLVVTACVWQVDGDEPCDLYARLKKHIARSPPRAGTRRRRLVIADSKRLYSSTMGLEQLECFFLAALHMTGDMPASWQSCWEQLCPGVRGVHDEQPWFESFDCPLPLSADPDAARKLGERTRDALAELGVRLVSVRSRAVYPQHFNELIELHISKGEALSVVTLELLSEVLAGLDDGPAYVVCDKHGGRNRYGALLQRLAPDRLVEVYGEGRLESTYRWGPAERRVEVCFRPRGERYLPTALASMASKYLRELAMRAFNDYWQARVENLQRTAGYPTDARRFKRAIAGHQEALGISDRVLWRVR
jgi:hypothetical protein